MLIQPNTILGHYKIRSTIGAGGMGEVFLAEDTELERLVALKVLPAEFSDSDERVRRFVQEAKSASALNHPNILTIYEIGRFENLRFIATEYIKGETLREKIKRGKLDLPEILDIIAQVAAALNAAHEAKIVHRDIKPENIMQRDDGLVKVLDFGLAKLTEKKNEVVDAESETIAQVNTTPGMVMGTVNYMSPEQARGKEINARSDIWSLGVVLYEMLARRTPFAEETMSDTFAAILKSEPAPLDEDTPTELQQIVRKSLQKNADERFQTVGDFLLDLKQLRKRIEFETELERNSLGIQFSEDNFDSQKTKIFKSSRTTQVDSSSGGSFNADTRNSIAVLPFVNLSADADNEFFCDGLAEELLTALAKIEELKVAARTSAFSFKGKDVNVSKIGQILNVNTVLEGSVRKSGNRLRILVQLVNAADGYHIWSERFDREMKDIFDVQDEITFAVVDALKVQLLGEEKAAVLKRYTDNTEAYELYLKGRFYINKHTPEGWQKAIEYYEQAIEKEPDYAPAYAALSSALIYAWIYGILTPQETIGKCRAATNRALELDGSLDESHSALARISFYYEWDWARTERACRRAIEINANNAQAHLGYGMFLVSRERFKEAVREGRRAIELDPLSLVAHLYMGWIYHFADRSDDVLVQVGKMIAIEPNFQGAYWLRGADCLVRGKYEEAVEALEKSLTLGGNPITKGWLGCAYGHAGKRDKALEILNQLLEMRKRQHSEAFNIARIYGGLGDKNKTFEWLSKAFDERNGELVLLDVGTKIGAQNIWSEGFRNDPRFENLLRRISSADENAHEASTNKTSEARTAKFIAPTTDRVISSAHITETENQQKITGKPKAKWFWLVRILPAALLIAVICFGFWLYTPRTSQIESIAVLPFVNVGGDANNEYLSDGLSESLINNLSRLPQLKVIARSSSFKYKGIDTDPLEVAHALGVQAIVTGRVAQRGDSLQISVELTNTADKTQIWGETYNRKVSDMQSVQEEIAHTVSQNLRLKLSGTQEQQMAKRETTNSEAYESMLKGRFHRIKGGVENTKKAVEYFNQAITVDPNYAIAYAELAVVYRNLIAGGVLDPKEFAPKAEDAARKALELDESLAEAHYALANLKTNAWNWAEAEREYKRAIELNPNIAQAHFWYSRFLSNTGRHEEAVAEIRYAREIDPLSPNITANIGLALVFAGRYDEAIAELKYTRELDPNYSSAFTHLGAAYAAKKMFGEAVAAFEQAIKLGDNTPGNQIYLGAALAGAGEQARATAILKQLEIGKEYVSPGELAILYTALGDKEKAFASLEKAYDAHDLQLQFLKADPSFNALRDDPRFQDLLRRVGLPQ